MGSILGLQASVLVAVTIALAVLSPVALVWFRLRRQAGVPGRWRPGARSARSARSTVGVVGVVGVVASTLLLALVAQAAAVGSVLLVVNDKYDFYSGWHDLLGSSSGHTDGITASSTVHAGDGRVRVLKVHGEDSRTRADVAVWLPPQYDEPAYRHHRFPVVMFLPGQPEQPIGAFNEFRLAAAAREEITSRHAPPFVMVMPPLMIRPPADTECTDVPHGPRALSWLSRDVPRAVSRDLRVQPTGRHWSVMGWSTGGFCAAKLLYSEPHDFDAAVGFGAYYQPDLQGVYPHLFGGEKAVADANSPEWLYRHRPDAIGRHLLIISSTQDRESWASTHRMLAATAGDPGVGHVTLDEGGHNFRVYQPYAAVSLAWLERHGSLA